MPKPKRPTGPAPFHILFGGESVVVELIDGTTQIVYVRAMPVAYLLSGVMRLADKTNQLIELCTYHNAPTGRTKAPLPAHPEIPAPTGKINVPHGWSDNLKPASARVLFKHIKALNFTEAADAAKDAIAAKEWQTPLVIACEQILLPMANRMAALLSSAMIARESPAKANAKS